MRRNKIFQDQHLAQTAVAAGSAFGWSEGDRDNAQVIAEWQARRRMATLVVPTIFALPFAASLAYYFVS